MLIVGGGGGGYVREVNWVTYLGDLYTGDRVGLINGILQYMIPITFHFR